MSGATWASQGSVAFSPSGHGNHTYLTSQTVNSCLERQSEQGLWNTMSLGSFLSDTVILEYSNNAQGLVLQENNSADHSSSGTLRFKLSHPTWPKYPSPCCSNQKTSPHVATCPQGGKSFLQGWGRLAFIHCTCTGNIMLGEVFYIPPVISCSRQHCVRGNCSYTDFQM